MTYTEHFCCDFLHCLVDIRQIVHVCDSWIKFETRANPDVYPDQHSIQDFVMENKIIWLHLKSYGLHA